MSNKYIYYKRTFSPNCGVGAHQHQGKKEKSKGKERDRGTDGETPKPIPGTDALIGDEEQNG